MSTHEEPDDLFGSGGSSAGANYTSAGQDPVNLFSESGYGNQPTSREDREDSEDLATGSRFSSQSGYHQPTSYGDQRTSLLANYDEDPSPALPEDDDPYNIAGRRDPVEPRWHGGADFGLLVLRLAVGGAFTMYGLQHLFRLFHGTGIDAFASFLQTAGYHYPTIMAWVGGGAELVGGALLILGLFTPAAAGAVLAVLANVVVLKWPAGFYAANGYQFQLLLAAAAFALLFAGPGRASLDRPTPWYRHPVLNGWLFLIIGAVASSLVLYLLRTH